MAVDFKFTNVTFLENPIVIRPYVSYTLHGAGAGTGTGTETRNNGFLYYAMYCTHYTGTRTGNHYFLLCPSQSLSLSRSDAVFVSHYLGNGSYFRCFWESHGSNRYVSLRLHMQNAGPAEPCVGKY